MPASMFKLLNIALAITSAVSRPSVSHRELVSSKGFISSPISKRTATSLDRRQLSASLSNQIRTYTIDVQIGSNGQKQTLSLDTGSSDTWFFTTTSCLNCTGATYDHIESITDQPRDDLGPFDLTYVDGTVVSGKYHSDMMGIDSTTVLDTTFAMVENTTESKQGILGLGLAALQSSHINYNTILDDMYLQRLISVKGYTLNLGAESSSTGSIVFGGYDAATYNSLSANIPIWSTAGSQASRLAIEWNGISVKDAFGTNTFSLGGQSRPVMLDSGYTLSTLPDDIFESVSRLFTVRKSGDHYYVPCKQGSGTVDFTFGDASTATKISVPFSELAVPANLQPGGDQDQDLCMFGFQPLSAWGNASDMMSFGDTFLRSAYVMADFDQMKVGLAQAKDTYCEQCIVPMTQMWDLPTVQTQSV